MEELKMDKIAVLIPCYNESQTIEKVVTDWKKELPEAVIYVYDNNSTDNTAEIARNAGAVVRYEYQQGKGNVIRRMFREIDAECYVMVDGDDTYPAEFGREMVSKVLDRKVDMVVGDRLSSTYFEENKRPFHNFGNSLVRGTINRLFKSNIRDIMTGYRAFSYLFVKTFPVLSKGFEIETEMSIHAVEKNMLVENVIIEYRDRPEGSESKLNTYSDGAKVLGTIARLYKNYRPFRFFGIVALLLMIISAVMFVPVLVTYIQTGLVPNFPTLIVSGFVALAAIQSFFAGLILTTLSSNSRWQVTEGTGKTMKRNSRNLFQQIIKFGFVGGTAFIIDAGVLFILTEFFNIHYLISGAISFTASVIYNYILSVRWVFDARTDVNKAQELTVFIGLSVIGLGLNQVLMWIFVDKLNIYYMLSKIIATAIVMVYNFITRKLFIERKN